ncbi:MAG: carboxypeptidase regulatory-like domain-containing protein, partial [FCB group bacterium]|nr:carboxypeptidase regulatory-like domain-containing protein [FCB group bacterium]
VILDAVLESLPEIDVQGTVTNALTNQPIEGAVIQIVDSPYDPENSGADGGFLFETIYAGTYNLHVYAQGYSAFYEEILFEEGMDPVQIQLTESDLVSFESGSLPDDWITLGSSGWVVVSDAAFDGLYSARSGDIDDDQISSLSITVDVPMDDEISFFCKVACEDDDNNNWDFLFFAIDGEEMERWDGIVNWHQETYPVSAGEHTFTWTYSKDGSVSHYDDAGWIDAINLPTGPDLTDVIPGDANLDGLVNVMDIVMTVNFILHVAEPDYEQFVAADMDGNGILNVLDLIGMVNLILNADQE